MVLWWESMESRTKDHHRQNFVVHVEEVYKLMNFVCPKKLRKISVTLASTQTDMFAAEYRSDNSSGLHCRVPGN